MFAVVRFIEENTISEVPSKWLDENNKCWWPHRNSKTHIIKSDVPGSTKGTFWQKYDVEILKTECKYRFCLMSPIIQSLSVFFILRFIK